MQLALPLILAESRSVNFCLKYTQHKKNPWTIAIEYWCAFFFPWEQGKACINYNKTDLF